MPKGITVIICCYNSINKLEPTLEHLAKQVELSQEEWEIILVDNNSNDHTADFASKKWNELNKPEISFRIVDEKTPGLSNARNKGIFESSFDYVLFCDDDNWLDERYVRIALDIISENLNIGCLGGVGVPVFEKNEPPLFWKNQYHLLAVGEQSQQDGDITDAQGVLYGAGMVVNKTAYNKLVNEFRFQFQVSDRIGNSLMSSGDHELCMALKRIGYRIFYSKKLVFKHYMAQSRNNVNYYKRLFIGFGMAQAFLLTYKLNKDNINSIKFNYIYVILRNLKQMVISQFKLLFTGYYFKTNKYEYIELLQGFYENKGMIRCLLKIKNNYKKNWYHSAFFQNS